MKRFGKHFGVLGRFRRGVQCYRGKASDEHDLEGRVEGGGPFREFNAVQTGHYDVGEQEVEAFVEKTLIGFRAIAERSMLADNGKDSGAVSMFPALAGEWSEQVEAMRGWKQFQRADFARLKARYRVDWVVLQQPGTRGLICPYQNDLILVCRVD